MAAADLITFEELRSKLAELDDARKTAERELETLRNHNEYLEGLERDRDALLASRMAVAPDALDALTSEERHQFYKMITLKVVSPPDGPLEVSGAFFPGQKLGTLEPTRPRSCHPSSSSSRRETR